MIHQWIHTSVKNQTIGAMNHHRNNACAVRFSSNRIVGGIAGAALNDNRGVP